MSTPAPVDPETKPHFVAAVDEYDRLVDAGLPVDREKLLAKYADIADELRRYFETVDCVEQLNRPPVETNVEDPPAVQVHDSFGDYELLEEVGRGGMGVVYKARQKSLNRLVAIKMIPSGRRAGEEDVKRLRREAESVAQLKHPNIAGAVEVGVHEGQPYFTMEYVDGLDLAALLRDQPPSPRQAAEYTRSIAETIHYAHQQGILHRDLKPANVMIDTAGQVKVMDFGLGKRLDAKDQLTQTGQILGTLKYMSPEQADADQSRVGPASDVYSTGAILYELLTGRSAFWSDSTAELLRQIYEQEPIAPQQLDPSIPTDLATICLKCLEKDPQHRYQTAAALAEDLRRYLSDEPILAIPPGPLRRAWKWCRRNIVVATLLLSVLIVLLAGVIVSTYFAIDANDSARRARQNELNEADARREALELAESERQLKDEALESAKREQGLVTREREARLSAEEAERTAKYEALRARTAHHAILIDAALQAWERHDVLTMRLWDTQTGQEVLKLDVPSNELGSVSWSPNGTRIAVGTGRGMIRIWDNRDERVILSAP